MAGGTHCRTVADWHTLWYALLHSGPLLLATALTWPPCRPPSLGHCPHFATLQTPFLWTTALTSPPCNSTARGYLPRPATLETHLSGLLPSPCPPATSPVPTLACSSPPAPRASHTGGSLRLRRGAATSSGPVADAHLAGSGPTGPGHATGRAVLQQGGWCGDCVKSVSSSVVTLLTLVSGFASTLYGGVSAAVPLCWSKHTVRPFLRP